MKTLADLPVGQQATITEVSGTDGVAVRIGEMGLVAGTIVTAVGAAPWGDPLEFEVRGFRLSLRKSEAARVHIS
ncbi:MAG: FeoA family protein [Pirellulales bacterium]|nr:FeoA family protein [Pirellulales bacterium]